MIYGSSLYTLQCNSATVQVNQTIAHSFVPQRFSMGPKIFLKRHRNIWFNNAKTLIENYTITPANAYSFSIPHVLDSLKERHHLSWIDIVQNMPKLRTYKHTQCIIEENLKEFFTRNQRSTLSRMRCGMFPLELENGRIRNIPLKQRLCKMCDSDEV